MTHRSDHPTSPDGTAIDLAERRTRDPGLVWRQIGLSLGLCALSAMGSFWAGWTCHRLPAASVSAARPALPPGGEIPATPSPAERVRIEAVGVGRCDVPRLAAKEIVALMSNRKTRRHLDVLFKVVAWAAQASEAELAEIVAQSNRSDVSDELLLIALVRWSEIDGLAAFNAFRMLDGCRRTSELTKNLFTGWMLYGSPEEAIECAAAFQTASDSCPKDLLGEMLETLAGKDPAQAEALAVGLSLSPDLANPDAVLEVIQSMVKARSRESGLAAGLALIGQCPRSDWQEHLHRKLAQTLLSSDSPDEQRQGYEVLSLMPDPYADASLLETVVDRKLKDDAASARSWALTLPVGEQRKTAITEIARCLSDTNRIQEAVDWLWPQSNHADFDDAYESLAIDAMENRGDAQAAFRIATQITDQIQGRRVQAATAAKWLQADFDSAARVIGPALVTYAAQLDAPTK